MIAQHGLPLLLRPFLNARRKRICRSLWAGTFLHPCSKLWIAFSETPSNRAISVWVFSRA